MEEETQKKYPGIGAVKLLRYTFALLFIIIGLDKAFFDFIAQWQGYVAPVFEMFFLVDVDTAFMFSGLAEVVLGILLFTKYAKAAAYLIALWLLAITVNLVALGAFDIALRDLALTFAAVALAKLENQIKYVKAQT